jgi:hypothetical protein
MRYLEKNQKNPPANYFDDFLRLTVCSRLEISIIFALFALLDVKLIAMAQYGKKVFVKRVLILYEAFISMPLSSSI